MKEEVPGALTKKEYLVNVVYEELANFLRLKECGETTVTNAMGSQERKLVSLTLYWHDEIYTIEASVIDRSGLSTPLILGLDIISQVDLSES